MKKAEVKRMVEVNNRMIKTQNDLLSCSILFYVVDKICRKNSWDIVEFFKTKI